MNTQDRQLFDSRWFQIGMLAALAVAIMVGAAYFFGIGLRADTAKSVAASPLGSSLTAIRESRLDDYYGRFSNSAAAETASRGNIAPARVNLPSADYARLGSLTPAEAKSLGNIAPARVNLPSADYARLGSLTAEEAASLGNIAPAATADLYQNEWMGFTAPESVGTSSMSSAAANSASLAAAGESRSNVSAGLDKGLRDQGIRSSAESSGGLVESSAADQDQFEWMGFTLPGSVEVKPSAPDQYHFQWRGLTVP